MEGTRIKDLISATPIVDKQFDTFCFAIDAPLPDTTLKFTGDLFTKRFAAQTHNHDEEYADIAHNHDEDYHPLGGDKDVDFAANDVEARNVVVDYLTARFGITTTKWSVKKVEATSGINISTDAYATISRIDDSGTPTKYLYKATHQVWRPGDQPRMQNGFGRMFWGVIDAVSDAADDDGQCWFTLKNIKVANSNDLAVGDELVLCGYRGTEYPSRSTVRISSTGADRADGKYYDAIYTSINSFDLPSDKECYLLSEDKVVFESKAIKFKTPDGSLGNIANERGAWSSAARYYQYDRVSHGGAVWLCIATSAGGVTTTPSHNSNDWLLQVDVGAAGNYTTNVFMWAGEKPARPAGSSPQGWCTATDNGAVITDKNGQPITDKAGNLLLSPYPKHYKLWSSVATFDGATSELIGDWGDPYQASATDGTDGTNGQDGTDGQDGNDGKDGDKGDKGDPGKDIDPAVQNDIAKQLGFASMPALSDYLADPSSFPFFEYNPATKILSVAKILTDAFAANEAFINKLIAQNAFVNNLVARSIDTRENGIGSGFEITRANTHISGYNQQDQLTFAVSADQGMPNLAMYRHKVTGVEVADLAPESLIFAENGKISTQLGKDGLLFRNNAIKTASFGPSGITLPPTAVNDMQGQLCVGRVNGTYCSVVSQMGILETTVVRVTGQTKGMYKITYPRLASSAKCFATATIYGTTYASLSIRVEESTPTQTIIRVHDNVNLNTTVDSDFTFVIYGENKWKY